ncbi:MAG TPA: hypothetical protein VGQ13_04590 [Nitrososphaera sp.]|nr:hypothetical protein [Nitrososphaera sp.]
MRRKNSKTVVISSALAALLIAGLTNQAYAAQINVSAIPEFDKAVGSFVGVKFVQVRYDPGSTLADLFAGKTERVEFSIKGTNGSGMSELVAAANQALLKVHSPAQITNANLTYSGVLRGEPDKLLLTYNVEFIAKFSGFKLDRNATDNIPMDINWRGFVINGPVLVDSPEDGRINVNQPIGLLESVFPEFAEKLASSEAREIIAEPILDFSELGAMPMDRWHWLFDPTFSLASTGGILKGEGIGSAKVMSVYSLGECSIREGCPPPKEGDATLSIDGTSVQVHISTPQPNSQIEIAGFTSIEKAGAYEIIRVKMIDPGGLPIPPFTIQVLLVLGGMMGAIAFFVLFRTRK